jgi:DNA-binding NtrC family response regulator/pSer/pThr/pTyr-binding forkhead associated (FHA) protein
VSGGPKIPRYDDDDSDEGGAQPTVETSLATNASTTLVGLNEFRSMEASAWRLRIVGKRGTQSYVVADGDHVIGRSGEATIRVDEDSVSRKHAQLSIGERVMLTDLGSLNGTRVRDRALKAGVPVEIQPGESFELGTERDSVILVLQRRRAVQKPRRQLYDHGYFETRVDEEIARAATARSSAEDSGVTLRTDLTERPVTLARLHLDGASKNTRDVDIGVVAETIEEVLPRSVIVAEYAPHELELLFVAMPWGDVEVVVDKLLKRLQQAGVPCRTGFGFFPRDGRTASSLLAAANARLSSEREDEPALVVAPPESGAHATRSPMERLQKLVERVAPSDISIVIHGETGVGKEVMAKELHRLSPRAGKPFVGLNCAALTETLLESELFGHERGSFSGAVATKPGLFEVADKGTVFLDEIGETSPAIQAKLLRVLEERTVLRVGGLHPRPIDVRFLAASHKDLEDEVAAGRFRQDLYFRLNGITLEIPPLRERTGELEGLCANFIADSCRRSRRTDVPTLSREAVQLLRTYAWPGNIRELRNVIERAVLLCTGPRITAEHLPADRMMRARAPSSSSPSTTLRPSTAPSSSSSLGTLRPAHARPLGNHPGIGDDDDSGASTRPAMSRVPPVVARGGGGAVGLVDDAPPTLRRGEIENLKGAVSDLERERITDALRACGGNQTKAAEMLGISRRTLLNRLDQFNLPRPRKGV